MFAFLASLDITYSVIAVDNAKNPINTNAMAATAIFVTMQCSAVYICSIHAPKQVHSEPQLKEREYT